MKNQLTLTDAEWTIMNCLWDNANLSIQEITNQLYEKTSWDKHTIISLLNRIEKKGGIAYIRDGRAKKYYPLVSKTETAVEETKSFLNKVYEGSLSLLVNSMIQKEGLSKGEIEELYDIIAKAEKRDE